MPPTTDSTNGTEGGVPVSPAPVPLKFPDKRSEQEGHDHDVCPRCSAELCAGLLLDWGKKMAGEDAENYAKMYGWPEKLCGSQTLGIELPWDDPRHYDGVSYWKYPCCGLVVDRFTREEVDWHMLDFAQPE